MLIDGSWRDEDQTIRDGAYIRPTSTFAKPLDDRTVRSIASTPGRFHLIASLSCPWSHRSTLTRAVKGLEKHIPLHIAGGPRIQGYRIGAAEKKWTVPGTDHHIEHLHELYTLADPAYTGRATVAVLWDAELRTIVSNESVHILRGLDKVSLLNESEWTLRPHSVAKEIDDLADLVQRELSNAVYRAGKARRQEVYQEAVDEVFRTLDLLETRLETTRYLHGQAIAETDLRLWPTLVRFDLVYYGHFKCARRRLSDYPNLWAYTRDILSLSGVAATFDPDAIRSAYYGEDIDLNPTRVVAVAPDLDWSASHHRNKFGHSKVWCRDGRLAPAHLAYGATE